MPVEQLFPTLVPQAALAVAAVVGYALAGLPGGA